MRRELTSQNDTSLKQVCLRRNSGTSQTLKLSTLNIASEVAAGSTTLQKIFERCFTRRTPSQREARWNYARYEQESMKLNASVVRDLKHDAGRSPLHWFDESRPWDWSKRIIRSARCGAKLFWVCSHRRKHQAFVWRAPQSGLHSLSTKIDAHFYCIIEIGSFA